LPDSFDDDLRARIAGAAGGNPLFLTEMVAIAGEADGQVAVPPTLKANQKYLQVGTLNGLTIYTDTSSNFVYSINGLAYHMPTIQGVPGSVFYNDGSGNITWQPVGNTFNFGDQFTVTGTNITLSTNLSVTNLVMVGSSTTPAVELGAVCGSARAVPRFPDRCRRAAGSALGDDAAGRAGCLIRIGA